MPISSNMIIKPYLNYCEAEIIALYKAVGWKNYYEKPEMLKEAYLHSLCALGAFNNGTLAGIIRVVGDGVSIIYIQDIIVAPSYQRQGIGSMLVKSVLNQYTYVYQKVLMTDNQAATVNFYKSLGFDTADRFGCIGFIHFTV